MSSHSCPSAVDLSVPQVALFQRVADPTTGAATWAYLEYKAPHTHDVRALALLPARGAGVGEGEGEGEEALLLSGGNDGQLIMYPAERFTKVRVTLAAGVQQGAPQPLIVSKPQLLVQHVLQPYNGVCRQRTGSLPVSYQCSMPQPSMPAQWMRCRLKSAAALRVFHLPQRMYKPVSASPPLLQQVHPTRQSLSPQTPLLQLAPAGGSGRLLQVAGRGASLWQLAEAGQDGEPGEQWRDFTASAATVALLLQLPEYSSTPS
jgi:hypothetical protein